jgi:hypothetical protein
MEPKAKYNKINIKNKQKWDRNHQSGFLRSVSFQIVLHIQHIRGSLIFGSTIF